MKSSSQQKGYQNAIASCATLGQLRAALTEFGKPCEDAKLAAYHLTRTDFKAFKKSLTMTYRPVMFKKRFGVLYRPAALFPTAPAPAPLQ